MAPFVYLAYLVWMTVASGSANFLTYDAERRELHFQCSPPGRVESHSLLQALVYRVPRDGGNSTLLAFWEAKGDKKGKSVHERVRVANGSSDYLDATLEHVSCYDSEAYLYRCDTVHDKSDPTESILSDDTFRFVGEISHPVITQDPLKSRYDEGDLLSLNCTALVGTADNGVVWEAGLPGGPFTPVITGESPGSEGANQEKQVKSEPCSLESHFPLKYRLSAEDDGKIFQCRLRRTNQTTSIAIAVKTGKEKCFHDAQSEGGKGSETGDVEPRMALQVNKPRSELKDTDKDAEGVVQSSPQWQIIVIACLAAMVIVALALAAIFVLRHRKNRGLQPLVVVEASTSSESAYADRRLPSVPDLQAPDTVPKWIAETHHRHLDSSLTNGQSDLASASVYVSMSAMDRCGEPETGTSHAQEEGADTPAEAETQAGAEELVSASCTESGYSNQGAMESECLSAATRVEVLKGGDGDDSVFIPSFVETD